MGRRLKSELSDHAITCSGDQNESLFVLVKGGRRAYLWASCEKGYVVTLSGSATLRAFAHAILAEVGDATHAAIAASREQGVG